MKKIITIILICSVPTLVKAQFRKGQIFLGGTLSFTTTQSLSPFNGGSSYSNSISVGPQFGVFISEKWALGVPIIYTVSSSKSESASSSPGFMVTSKSTSSSYTWGFGLSARRYFKLSEKVFLTLEGKATYSSNNVKSESSYTAILSLDSFSGATSTHFDGAIYALNVNPLLVVFPSPVWSIEGGLSSLTFEHTEVSNSSLCQNDLIFSLGTVSLGVSYYFGRKE